MVSATAEVTAAPADAIEALHEATALYTERAVVDQLLDRVGWWRPNARLLDPSCGDGSFLVRALHRVPLQLNDVESAVDLVQGWEIHRGAADQARALIRLHLISRGWVESHAEAAARGIVKRKDLLLDGPETGEFNVIVGNPPYLRFARLPEYFKKTYSETQPRYALGDMLHLFLDWCAKAVGRNGRIGLVCSDRFLFNEKAATLRATMGARVELLHLARLDPRSTFYREKKRIAGAPPRVHPVEVVLRSLDRDTADKLRATMVGVPLTDAPISPDDFGRPGNLPGTKQRTLGDIAEVRLAPWLGPKGIFVVDDAKLKELGLWESPSWTWPAVDTDDLVEECVRFPTGKWALRTTRDVKPQWRLGRHLLGQRRNMPPRGRRKEWWLPPELVSFPLDQMRLVVPRIANRLRAIRLPAGVLPINHNLSVVSAAPGTSLDDLKRLLTCEASQEWIRRHAPRLEGGYYSITTKLLRRLPV